MEVTGGGFQTAGFCYAALGIIPGMWNVRSIFVRKVSTNPVVLAYELYGLIIAVGMGCLLPGVTAMNRLMRAAQAH